MKTDDLLTQARAKMIWGEPSSAIRDFLTSNGFSDKDADAKIKGFAIERNTEIRRIGIKKIVIGAALALGAWLLPNRFTLVGGLYGLGKLINGIETAEQQ